MDSHIEQEDATTYRLSVEVPAEDVDRKLDEVYRRIVKDLEIPGFRKGHVPRSYLETRFGPEILHEDAQRELLEEYLPQALREHELTPASQPELQEAEFDAGQPFRFEATVEVFPDVELPEDASELVAQSPAEPEITEESVEEMLEEMRYQHATLIPREEDAVIEDEDVVTVRTQGGETKDLQAQAEGWTASLIGQSVGDTVELQGTESEAISVTIDSIQQIELPDLEDLAATLGHDDAEALREATREDLRQRAEQEQERRRHEAALDALVAASGVTVPDGSIDEALERELSRLREQGQEPSDEERSELRDAIARRLRRDRVLEAYKNAEGLTLDEEEFEAYLQEEAEARDMPVVKFRALLEREGQLERLRAERENRQALEHLAEAVQWAEPEASRDAQSDEEAS